MATASPKCSFHTEYCYKYHPLLTMLLSLPCRALDSLVATDPVENVQIEVSWLQPADFFVSIIIDDGLLLI